MCVVLCDGLLNMHKCILMYSHMKKQWVALAKHLTLKGWKKQTNITFWTWVSGALKKKKKNLKMKEFNWTCKIRYISTVGLNSWATNQMLHYFCKTGKNLDNVNPYKCLTRLNSLISVVVDCGNYHSVKHNISLGTL